VTQLSAYQHRHNK